MLVLPSALRRITLALPLFLAACAEGVNPGPVDDGSAVVEPGSGGGFAGSGGFPTGSSGFGGGISSGGGFAGSGGALGTGGTSSATTGGATGTGGVPADVDAGSARVGDLVLQYRTSDTDPHDGNLKPEFNVINKGTKGIALHSLKIRYYYTADAPSPGTSDYQQLTVDYADVTRTHMNTTLALSFAALKPAQPKADTYEEVSFTGNDLLEPGEATGQLQTRINWLNYTVNYDETNDYSWDGTKTNFADWQKVTLYQNGNLVWGVEPDGTRPKEPPEAGVPGGNSGDASDASHPSRDASRD